MMTTCYVSKKSYIPSGGPITDRFALPIMSKTRFTPKQQAIVFDAVMENMSVHRLYSKYFFWSKKTKVEVVELYNRYRNETIVNNARRSIDDQNS